MKQPASIRLMKSLGWAGGTIHQVSASTGLSQQQIITLDDIEILPDQYNLGVSDYDVGFLCGAPKSIAAIKLYKGNIQYWKGVADKEK